MNDLEMRILEVLTDDARTSAKQIAVMLGREEAEVSAAIRSMEACEAEGIERYVMVSYDGAGKDHGIAEDSSFFPYAEAKAAADEHLRESKLKWTILGPGALTEEPGNESIGVGDDKREDRKTSRDVVADVIAAVLRRPDTVGRTIEFSDGDTPIGEALTRE